MILDAGTGAVGGGLGKRLLAVALASVLLVGFGAYVARGVFSSVIEDDREVHEIDLQEIDDDAWLEDAEEGYDDDDECLDVDASEEPVETETE